MQKFSYICTIGKVRSYTAVLVCSYSHFDCIFFPLDATQEERNILKEPEWCLKTFGNLLGDSSTHDVIFKTSDGGRVSGHRAVIAAGSPVFHAMLYGNMKESNEKEIELPSVDTSSLQCLLTFMYTGQVEATPDECSGLLLAARYFNVVALEAKCIDTIAASLNDLNCCKFTIFAVEQQLNVLLQQCYEYMQSNMDKVIDTPEFKCLPAESITEICNNSELCIKELDLFFAVREWSEYQKASLPEQTIKSIFRLIRYPLIHIANLIELVGPSNLADPYLYKTALEYHILPNNFSGPQDQIKLRKYYFDFQTTSTGMLIKHSPKGTLIANQSEGLGQSCKCFADIDPTESNPVQFKFCLNCYGEIKLLVGTQDFKTYTRLPVHRLPLHQEIDGCITLKEHRLRIKVGNENSSIPFEEFEDLQISFGVYIKNKGGEVQITKM